MAYSRRNTEDGVTIMNRELYDNLQDGIEEAKRDIANISNININTIVQATVEEE